MKNYTKEQIHNIVSETSKMIIDKNHEEFVQKIIQSVEGKNDYDAMMEIIIALYLEAQKNSADMIEEILIKIFDE